MQITFRHNNQSVAIVTDAPAEIKLYAVPPTYSEDGYYAAMWMPRVLEPVPGCAAEEAELLAHVRITEQQDGQAAPVAVYLREGVTYAAN